MPRSTTSAQQATQATQATQAVDEAIRTISEASQNGTQYAQRALSNTRAYLTDVINPRLFKDGANDVELLLKTSFGLQNAVLGALPAMFEASFSATRSALEAYTTLAEQQQKIVLAATRRAATAAEQLATPSK